MIDKSKFGVGDIVKCLPPDRGEYGRLRIGELYRLVRLDHGHRGFQVQKLDGSLFHDGQYNVNASEAANFIKV